jgi:hypothetical protein
MRMSPRAILTCFPRGRHGPSMVRGMFALVREPWNEDVSDVHGWHESTGQFDEGVPVSDLVCDLCSGLGCVICRVRIGATIRRARWRKDRDDLFETLTATDTPVEHNPGGKVMIPLPPNVIGWATFGGPNDCYRYCLARSWPSDKGTVLVIMMNPSTANPLFDDPTIAKRLGWPAAGMAERSAHCWSATYSPIARRIRPSLIVSPIPSGRTMMST